MNKIAIGLKDLSDIDIVHRDLHLSNIVLHFPQLEPTKDEMNDIYTYIKKLDRRRHQILTQLDKIDFNQIKVKFIDFGLSKMLEPDLILATPVGVLEIIPPEMEQARTKKVMYDSRVDVWNCGLIFYMMLFRKLMFKNQVDATTPNGKIKYKMYEKNTWSVEMGQGSPKISLEALKFIADTVKTDHEARPYPGDLINHPYFKVDLKEFPPLQDLLVKADIDYKSYFATSHSSKQQKIVFNTETPQKFYDFYKQVY